MKKQTEVFLQLFHFFKHMFDEFFDCCQFAKNYGNSNVKGGKRLFYLNDVTEVYNMYYIDANFVFFC